MTETGAPPDRPAGVPPADSAAGDAISPEPPVAAAAGGSGWRIAALGLGLGLALVVALVASAPLWAPLLPWGQAQRSEDKALTGRLDRLDGEQQQSRKQLVQLQQQTGAATTTLHALEQRVAAVEAKPAPAPADVADLRQKAAALSNADAELAHRVDALEQDMRGQAATATALAARLAAVEKGAQAQAGRQTGNAALALALLQIRAAIDAGRPFPAEYDTLIQLSRGEPALAEAAAPLAEPAKTGVATGQVLAARLHALAGDIAGATQTPTAAASWTDAALTRLRGLVTIRHIDAAAEKPVDSAVAGAERALAGGDVAGAVAALEGLSGAAANAAAPWLRTARQRLAVDAALRQIEALLTARLGRAAGSAG